MRDDSFRQVASRPPKPARKWGRGTRLGVALGLLGAGAYAIADEALILSSDHAVISANVVVLRTPIDGEVTSLSVRPGEQVGAGGLLGAVENTRVDKQRVYDLRAQVQRLAGEEESLARARDSLHDLQTDLASRVDLYSHHVQNVSAERLEEAERLADAVAARASRLDKEWGRRESLRKLGLTPDAEMERAAADALAAGKELAAAKARTAAIRAQRDGAFKNVFVEVGSHGASYAQQRMDEVALRLADLAQLIGVRQAERAAAQVRLAAEEDRIELLRRAELRSPGAGTVWRVIAAPGEHTPANAPLVELVDCRAAFLLAAAPQSRAARIAVGDSVRYRLAGENKERRGVISAVLGSHSAEGERFSAVPTRPSGPATMVRVTPEDGGSAGAVCDVGRTARIIFAASSGGLLGSLSAPVGASVGFMRRIAAAVRQKVG